MYMYILAYRTESRSNYVDLNAVNVGHTIYRPIHWTILKVGQTMYSVTHHVSIRHMSFCYMQQKDIYCSLFAFILFYNYVMTLCEQYYACTHNVTDEL